MNKVPKDTRWCTLCVAAENYGRKKGEPCEAHADGDYSGPDAYEPSDFVLETVGKRFTSFDRPYLCFGYDPRHGFWMRDEASGEQRNVSERAIGRTFHRIWERVGPDAAPVLGGGGNDDEQS